MQGAVHLFFQILFVAGAVALVGTSFYLRERRARDLLLQWAGGKGYKLLWSEYRIMKGPFLWNSASGQLVYRVRIRAADGVSVHDGWVRCGGRIFGILSSHTEVKWDRPMEPAAHAAAQP
jgi:hypothetical protein